MPGLPHKESDLSHFLAFGATPMFLDKNGITYLAIPTYEQLLAYFELRKTSYIEVLGWKNFYVDEDEDDKRAYFVLAEFQRKIVGGIRLVMHKAGTNARLPMEEPGFLMQDIFPALDLSDKSYFEAGRLAITKKFRSRSLINSLFRGMLGLGQVENCRYFFAISPMVQARLYRQIFHDIGGHYEITNIFAPPKAAYENVPVHLALLDLAATPDYRMLISEYYSSPYPTRRAPQAAAP